MNKIEIAKELTIAALQNKAFNSNVDSSNTYKDMNEQIADNVAAFFNKLLEKLNINE